MSEDKLPVTTEKTEAAANQPVKMLPINWSLRKTLVSISVPKPLVYY